MSSQPGLSGKAKPRSTSDIATGIALKYSLEQGTHVPSSLPMGGSAVKAQFAQAEPGHAQE